MTEQPNLVAGDEEGTPLEGTDHLVNGRVPGEGSGLLTETEDGAVTPIDGKPFSTGESITDETKISDRSNDERTIDDGANTKLQTQDRGTLVGNDLRTWGARLPQYIATLPKRDQRTKARICFNFDSTNIEHYNEIYPEMRDRGLPWTDNVHHSYLGTSGRYDLNQLREMNLLGMEVGNYVRDELGAPDGEQTLMEVPEEERDEMLLMNYREMQDRDLNVTRFKGRKDQGIRAVGNEGRDEAIDSTRSHGIRSLYPCSGNGWRGNDVHHAPSAYNYGRENVKAHGTATEMQQIVDEVVAINGTLEFFTHVSDSGFDLTEFTTLLDHVESERAAGNLEVSTTTGSYLYPHELDAVNVVPDPDFSASAQHGLEPYYFIEQGDPTVNSDGGYVGSDYAVLGSGDRIRVQQITTVPQFPVNMLRFAAKAPDTTTAQLEVHSLGFDNAAGAESRMFDLDDTWTEFYFPFGCSRNEGNQVLRLWQASGTVHLDDLHVYPV